MNFLNILVILFLCCFVVQCVYEDQLPFSSIEYTSAVVADDGAVLQLGDTHILFKAGSLPVDSVVTAMVQKFDDGFTSCDETTLSSVITIGPHQQ